MYRILNRFTGKNYGDCETKEEADDLKDTCKDSIVVDLSIDKNRRKKSVQKWWVFTGSLFNDMNDGLITKEEFKTILSIWQRLDAEYTAMYDEEY